MDKQRGHVWKRLSGWLEAAQVWRTEMWNTAEGTDENHAALTCGQHKETFKTLLHEKVRNETRSRAAQRHLCHLNPRIPQALVYKDTSISKGIHQAHSIGDLLRAEWGEWRKGKSNRPNMRGACTAQRWLYHAQRDRLNSTLRSKKNDGHPNHLLQSYLEVSLELPLLSVLPGLPTIQILPYFCTSGSP